MMAWLAISSPPKRGRGTAKGDGGGSPRLGSGRFLSKAASTTGLKRRQTPPPRSAWSPSPASPGSTRDARGGFTLVELLVVLVILGLVMGLVGPRVLGYLSSSRERTAHLQIESFASALDLFYLDYGRYPTNSEGLEALVRRPAAGAHWAGPYLKQPNVPADPWGSPYQYHVPGKTTPYSITSLGPDGERGGMQHAAIGNE